jgi:putative transposase
MEAQFRKTRKSWDEPGHAHFLTYSCFNRLPLLKKDRTRLWVIDAMAETRRRMNLSLWAYVIMPEHVHLLLRPRRSDYEIRLIVACLKRSVSESAKRFLEASGNEAWLSRLTVRYPSRSVFRFWQAGGGFDRNIFHERSVPAIIDYIHANPIRRGLVDSATDWPWSSARFWDGHKDPPIEMDQPDV